MSAQEPVVYIVDDDVAVREALADLVSSIGLQGRTSATAEEFLAAYEPSRPACLILDVRMPGMSGLGLQDHLLERGIHIPIIFLSGHADVPMAVEAIRKGAFDFLEKPVRNQTLLDKVNAALEQDRQRQERRLKAKALEDRLASLTPREAQVLDVLKRGKSTVSVAATLGIGVKTVQAHRARILEKLGAESVAALVKQFHSACMP
jgi:FixJ family two-component response regulator